jgi:hypothetical protein
MGAALTLSNLANFGALVIAVLALVTSMLVGWHSRKEARHSNAIPTLVELFREHRSDELTEARRFVYFELSSYDPQSGFDGIPEEKRSLVRDLTWYYDHLGVLVAHGVVDIEPVSGYLGGTLSQSWEALRPFIEAERAKRIGSPDPSRSQIYYENLYLLVSEVTPQLARKKAGDRWRVVE